MIIGIKGNLGAGKTLVLTLILLLMDEKSSDDFKVVTNYHTDVTDEYVTNPMELEEISKELEGIQGLDEIWGWADSRNSGNNEIFNEMIINSRKRGWIVVYTAQNFHMVDKRLRQNTDYGIIPEHHKNVGEDKAKLHIFSMDKGELEMHLNTKSFNPEAVYNTYDTREEVGTKSKGNVYENLIEEYAEKLRDGEYQFKNEMVADLKLEEDLSKTDAQDITHKVFNEVKE